MIPNGWQPSGSIIYLSIYNGMPISFLFIGRFTSRCRRHHRCCNTCHSNHHYPFFESQSFGFEATLVCDFGPVSPLDPPPTIKEVEKDPSILLTEHIFQLPWLLVQNPCTTWGVKTCKKEESWVAKSIQVVPTKLPFGSHGNQRCQFGSLPSRCRCDCPKWSFQDADLRPPGSCKGCNLSRDLPCVQPPTSCSFDRHFAIPHPVIDHYIVRRCMKNSPCLRCLRMLITEHRPGWLVYLGNFAPQILSTLLETLSALQVDPSRMVRSKSLGHEFSDIPSYPYERSVADPKNKLLLGLRYCELL